MVRAVEIIELLATSRNPVPISDVWRQLGIPRVSSYELISTLAAKGIVKSDERGLLELGPRVLVWGGAYSQSTDLAREARNGARKLSERCGETVHVAILEGSDALYVVKEEGSSTIRVATGIGTRMPAHATGVGKVLLAYLSEAELVAVLGTAPLATITPATISDPVLLMSELRQIVASGIGIDEQESTPEVSCVAAPIRDHHGQVVAAISMSMLSGRLDQTWHGEAVRQAGEEISVSLGWRGEARIVADGSSQSLGTGE